MITCPHCLKDVITLHNRSHVVPSWMHDEIYDDKHRAIALNFSEKTRSILQTGEYGSFICYECETYFGKFDRYASIILGEKSPTSKEFLSLKITRKVGEVGQEFVTYEVWEGYNFRLLQGFVISVVLRGHYYRLSKGKGGLLIDKHIVGLKECLTRESADDLTYPFVLMRFFADDTYRTMVELPWKNRFDLNRCISFSGAGFQFYQFVSSHPPPDSFWTMKFNATGAETFLLVLKKKDTASFRAAAKIIRKNRGRFK